MQRALCIASTPTTTITAARYSHFTTPAAAIAPDLNHSWFPTQQEANYANPNNTLGQSLNNGFVLVSDQTEQIDNGVESPTDDQTMGSFNQVDIPFYYDLAQKFAISDRHFSSVLGPTFPNRSYLMAATSFGHLTTKRYISSAGTHRLQTNSRNDF
jgi:phospholipase C